MGFVSAGLPVCLVSKSTSGIDISTHPYNRYIPRSSYEDLSTRQQPTPPGESLTIIGGAERLRAHIKQTHPEWCGRLVRLAVAALTIYRMRLVDVSLRDHVRLLWVFLGGYALRAHTGQAFFFNALLGSWHVFAGILPQSVYEDCFHLV